MFWSWKFWSEIHLWTDHHWITWQKSFKVSRLDCWGASRDSTADCFGHPANDWQSGDIEALQITDCLQKIYSHNTLVTKQIIGSFATLCLWILVSKQKMRQSTLLTRQIIGSPETPSICNLIANYKKSTPRTCVLWQESFAYTGEYDNFIFNAMKSRLKIFLQNVFHTSL